MRLIFSIFLSSFLLGGVSSQNSVKGSVIAIDMYSDYLNKSIDGGFIVQRLLENYNKDINQYVDIESHQINFYTNADLPKNLYASEWFFDPTPKELYVEIKSGRYPLSSKSSKSANYIVENIERINNELNSLRFNIEENISNLDLTDRKDLGIIYGQLERGVTLYEDFYKFTLELKNILEEEYDGLTFTDSYASYHEVAKSLYEINYKILQATRNEDSDRISRLLPGLEKAISGYNNFNISGANEKVIAYKKTIVEKAKDISGMMSNVLNNEPVPEGNQEYGVFYFNYNYEGLSRFNEQGPGLVSDLNKIDDELKSIYPIRIELPYFYKVIYPKKIEKIEILDKEVAPIKGVSSTIEVLPSSIEDRDVVIVDHKIRTDRLDFEVSVYDHLIEDGDIISLNFNDTWIVKEQMLTKKPFRIELLLNSEGKNYLLLHAVNVGRRPPNTIAIDYTYYGKKKRIILESDLDKSEMIEIEYVH